MRLGELLNKIFRKRRQPEMENRKMAEDIYKASEYTSAENIRFENVEKKIVTEQTNKSLGWKEKFQAKSINISIAVIIVVGAVLIALFMVLYVRVSNSTFSENAVKVSIEGTEIIKIGQTIEYNIILENNNRAKLQNVTLNIDLPSNFNLQESPFIVDKNLTGAKILVGNLDGYSQKKYPIKIIANYSSDSQEAIKVFAKYKPSNISSFFQSNAFKPIKLTKADISMLMMSAGTASSGEIISLDMVVKNNSSNDFNDLLLKVDFPEGFEFINSNLEPINEQSNEWIIKKMNIGEQYKINIQGKLTGKLDTIKMFTGTLKSGEDDNASVLYKIENNIKIIPNKVLLQEITNNTNVYPGEDVYYKILFKNNSTVSLRNLIIKTYLFGDYIDKSKVQTEYGYYDSRKNTIIWKAGDFQQLNILQPGEEGTLKFSVKLKNSIIFKDKKDKNPYLLSYSEIESLDVDSPLFENKRIISTKVKTPINSVMQVTTTAEYLSNNSDETSEDILKVNRKARIKIQLALSNTTNRLKHTKLVADLPSGVSWEKQIYPKGDNLKFNDRSHKLEWSIGAVEVGTGILSPPEKAEFIINVIPSANQINQAIELIKNIKVSAEDTFTDNNIKYEFKNVTSRMIQGLKDGLVQN